MWVRLDDQFHSHPKAEEAWHRSELAVGLYVFALSRAGCYLTDGHVSEAFVTTKIPAATKRKKAVGVLVTTGLWDADPDGGWWIHDYLKYNESRAQILARREADSRRKRNGIGAEA